MKTYLHFLSLLLLTAINGIAQPTINLNDIKYTVGQTLTYNRTYYEAPGDSGANQTWDLSGMVTGQVSVFNTVDASSTPNAASFPNANIALGTTGGYSYYSQSANALRLHGISGASYTIPYSNPEDFLRFPATYNDSYTDTWGSTFVSGGVTFYRTGVTDIKVDGYGTLLLPNNVTYNNVLRVHFYQVYRDSSVIQGIPNIINYLSETYMWYVSGVPGQVASVNQFETIGGPSQTSGIYTAGMTSSLNDVDASLNINVYPNPVAANFVTVSFESLNAANAEVKWISADGRVLSSAVCSAIAGNNTLRLAMPDISNGLYQLLLFIEDKPVAVKRVAVAR